MNKKLILVIAVVFVIILGAGAFFTMKKSPSQVSNTQTNSGNVQENKENDSTTIQGTLNSLITGGKSVKCTFSTKEESVPAEGTVYVANGKMRGDFKSTSENTTVNGHMIVDSQFSYVWTDMSNQGFKVAITEENVKSAEQNQAPGLNQSVNYSCQNWSEDKSVFNLPANVTFQTFTVPSVSSKNPTSGSDTDTSAQCAACNSIPEGPARDACKAQLNCE